jgi:hypothetical protein
VTAVVALLTVLASANVTLAVRYDDGAGQRHRATLSCRGDRARATGYLSAAPVRACRRARAMPPAPPKDRMCTQIYGGPQTARIAGRVGARRIDRVLSRTNGCKIDEWSRMAPLVPPPKRS